MDKNYKKIIGNEIKNFRKEKGIMQKDLAEMLDIPVSTLANYETGRREPSLEIILKIRNLIKENKPNQTSYYFKFDNILNHTYDIFEHIYNHTKIKSNLNLTAKEFMNKDKYFIDELANNFYQTVFVKISALKERIVNKDDKTPLDNSIKIKYAPNNKDRNRDNMIIESTNHFELGNKLNDKKYLKYMIDKYQEYLDNIEEGKDNYKLIEEELEEARKKYNKNQNNKEDNNIREATQEDIDNFFGR